MLVERSTTHDPYGFFKVPKDGKQTIGGLMKTQKEAWVFVQWDEQMKQKQLGSNIFCGMVTCLYYVYLTQIIDLEEELQAL